MTRTLVLTALLLSVLLAIRLVWREATRRPLGFASPAGMLLFVVVALVVNACVCANLSGLFGRYQGRVAWLLPVLVAAATLARGREAAAPEGASGR